MNALVRRFIKAGIPFKKYSTNGRTILVAGEDWGSYECFDSVFPANELNFIKSVKEYVIKHETYKNVRNYFGKPGKDGANKRIKYFYYNKNIKPGTVIEGGWEVDISNCYWDTAFVHYNLFSEELYKKGLTVKKKSRLAAIGGFAKTQNVVEFDGNEERMLDPIRSDKTEFLWHTICNKIGKTMYKACKIAKQDFLFFWIDGIFLKDKTHVDAVQEFFKKQGYESTATYCEWIKFNDSGLVVKCTKKGKWVKKQTKEIVERGGKKFMVIKTSKVFKDERPFPYGNTLSDKDIIQLANE